MKLSQTQERLLRRFRRSIRRKQLGWHDVCIHESSNRGGRWSVKTFHALYEKGLIEPSVGEDKPIALATWWKITQAGINHLSKERS